MFVCLCQCVSVTVGELALGFLIGRRDTEREEMVSLVG